MRAYVSISAHGFGHLAQIAPIVSALQRRAPHLQTIVRSGLPRSVIGKSLPNTIVEVCDDDFGIPMHGIHCAPVGEITSYWLNQCHHSIRIQDQIADRLAAEQIDFVISGVSPWPLAAAAQLGIPSFGVGSFSWSEVLNQILRDETSLRDITKALDFAYSKASSLFALQPGLSMGTLAATPVAGTIVRKGRARRAEILSITRSASDAKIVVFAFGGMIPIERPNIATGAENWALFTPTSWAHEGLGIEAASIPIPFSDLIASADLIVSKVGYGIATEVAAFGTPSIFVQRHDWPEDQPIMDWLRRHSDCTMVRNIGEITKQIIEDKLRSVRIFAPPMDRGEEFVADQVLQMVQGRDFSGAS